MREIRFRGQRIDNGEWVYGSLLIHEYGTRRHVIVWQQTEPYSIQLSADVDPDTVGQFTGLKDRNGKEIYEGDKVKWTSTYPGASKKVHEDEIQWQLNGWMLMPFCHELHAADMEVIGPIHDKGEA